ncbi:MAG: hypothetical protein ACK5DG_14795 [Chitinophagaceae bacterium]|jgi:hypothetical protein
MKQYKLAEIVINSVLIFGFVFVFSITQSFELLFASYFIVGGIQLLSMIFHLVKGWFSAYSIRFMYYIFLLFIGVLCIYDIGFFFLLFAAPFMAVFYVFICYKEWKILKYRDLVHLK